MEFGMDPIGTIHSPFTQLGGTPIQASRSTALGQVSVFPQYVAGLEGLDGFSHIFILYVFHRSNGYELTVEPFLDDIQHGVFATRYPRRPNPLGISVVKLISCHGNILEIEGVDVLDETPLLDIKPYIPDFDVREGARTGWYGTRSKA